ncbi:unnamed protein product [Rotaria sp. Silwood1]|nr:unnamed protein product [Rotaria sp. Silwood1]CAF3701584.1 unnamed protein product [Rotaria sp. Silwood1]CAF4795877.1 unnamed protein product [Rotaria sp. Silwood1]
MNEIDTDFAPIVEYAQEPLLPLSEACVPLIDILHDLSVYVQLALDETPESPPDGLTVDESAAIRLYTIEWERPHRSLYSMLNYTLKNANREELRPYFKYLKLFLTALVKIPCVPPLTVWRGVTKNLSAEFPPGTLVTWWSFSSCTTSLTVLENNMYLGNTGARTLFSVEAINGRTVSAHSHFVTEEEILLLPGTHMIVQSQLSPAPDLYIIHLKQVIPVQTLLEPPFEVYQCSDPYPSPKTSNTGKLPIAIVYGDFTNVNQIDLAVLNYDDRTVDIVLGNGKNDYETEFHYSTDVAPNSVFNADLNHDGLMDIIVVNGDDDSISVLLDNDDETFQTSIEYLVGDNPMSVTGGDFNNDTLIDILVANADDDTVSLVLGDEEGTFSDIQIEYDVGSKPVYVISGDFNQDEKLDWAVINQGDNTTSMALGYGNATFSDLQTYTVGATPISMTYEDFNKDGKVDLVVANYDDNSISVLLGNRDGTFQAQITYEVGMNPSAVVAADFNNDSKIDLALTLSNESSISVLYGYGNGSFWRPVKFETHKTFKCGASPNFVISVDLNRDQIMDLVVANLGDHTISILFGWGNGAFRAQVKYDVDREPSHVMSGDFNNDNKMDIAVVGRLSHNMQVLFGDGNMTLSSRKRYGTSSSPGPAIAYDFNKDGKTDIAVLNKLSSVLYIFLNECS